MRFESKASIRVAWLAALASVACWLAITSSAHAERALCFEVAGVVRSTDLIHVSAPEATRTAMPGGEAEVSAGIPRSSLRAVLGGGIGGSWYFEEGPGYHARVSYTEWRGHVGVQATPLRSTHADLEVAALVEYGELRSWLENLYVSRSGPRAYYVGGGLKLRAVGRPLWQLRPTLGMQADVFRAHGDETSSATKYAWIGEALTLSLGIRY